ncbi:unnamed protein product [Amoebophrya sp. A120]|nr:unnamed protein product [Amoebophrya sp. A120]|eukprot:GSA120T00012859001.1
MTLLRLAILFTAAGQQQASGRAVAPQGAALEPLPAQQNQGKSLPSNEKRNPKDSSPDELSKTSAGSTSANTPFLQRSASSLAPSPSSAPTMSPASSYCGSSPPVSPEGPTISVSYPFGQGENDENVGHFYTTPAAARSAALLPLPPTFFGPDNGAGIVLEDDEVLRARTAAGSSSSASAAEMSAGKGSSSSSSHLSAAPEAHENNDTSSAAPPGDFNFTSILQDDQQEFLQLQNALLGQHDAESSSTACTRSSTTRTSSQQCQCLALRPANPGLVTLLQKVRALEVKGEDVSPAMVDLLRQVARIIERDEKQDASRFWRQIFHIELLIVRENFKLIRHKLTRNKKQQQEAEKELASWTEGSEAVSESRDKMMPGIPSYIFYSGISQMPDSLLHPVRSESVKAGLQEAQEALNRISEEREAWLHQRNDRRLHFKKTVDELSQKPGAADWLPPECEYAAYLAEDSDFVALYSSENMDGHRSLQSSSMWAPYTAWLQSSPFWSCPSTPSRAPNGLEGRAVLESGEGPSATSSPAGSVAVPVQPTTEDHKGVLGFLRSSKEENKATVAGASADPSMLQSCLTPTSEELRGPASSDRYEQPLLDQEEQNRLSGNLVALKYLYSQDGRLTGALKNHSAVAWAGISCASLIVGYLVERSADAAKHTGHAAVDATHQIAKRVVDVAVPDEYAWTKCAMQCSGELSHSLTRHVVNHGHSALQTTTKYAVAAIPFATYGGLIVICRAGDVLLAALGCQTENISSTQTRSTLPGSTANWQPCQGPLALLDEEPREQGGEISKEEGTPAAA